MYALLPLLLSIALCHSSGASGSGEEPSVDRETLEQLRGLNGQELSILEEEAKGAPVTDGYRRAVEGEADRRRQAEFITAAQTGDTATVRRFIDSKAYDIDFRDENGDTLLIHAIRNGQSDTAAVLKKAGASEAVKNHEGHTALTVGNKDKVQTFIRFAKSTKPSRKRNALLLEFTRLNAGRLSTNEAIALAWATTLWFKGGETHNDIISAFFRAREAELSAADLQALSGSLRNGVYNGRHIHDSIFEAECKREVSGMERLCDQSDTAEAPGKAEGSKAVKNREGDTTLTVGNKDKVQKFIEFAKSTKPSKKRNALLLEFARVNAKHLSTNEAIALARATTVWSTGMETHNDIISVFFRAREAELSAADLQALSDSLRNGAYNSRYIHDRIFEAECKREVSGMMRL